ncbi:MAG: sugar phosphate isomerase/epimerase [Kiritimatiellae bacterium]|jgi:sugar phosphate isomerase/epimerase|nr:sugar phosphate isomerase/epimerase [Kiritimatiellia bacterium]MDD2347700.1 TIM barrel protein [Kiritimatiellia bacterium]MDD3585392.1 TIM barrel protein [Kiritimatiellia bacterium]
MRGNVSRAICLVAVLVMKTAFADYSYSVFAWDIRKIMKQRGASVEQVVELLKDAGVTGFDASYEDPQIPELVACGLKAVNFFGKVPCRDRSGGGEIGEALLATAVRYGAKRVMVFPEDFVDGEDRERAFEAMAVGLEAFARKSAAAGVQTTIEDFGAGLKNPCSHGLYLKRFLKACPHVALALDSGNLYYAGRGDDILDVMEAAGDRIGHVHLKDQAHDNPRSFVTLGTGAVPNREILRRLVVRGYKGWITIENPVGDDLLADVRRQIAFVRSVTREPLTETHDRRPPVTNRLQD